MESVATSVDELMSWLRDAAWPTWLAHGVDRERGGFFEALDLQTKTCNSNFRRLRVAARQTYVFAEAHRAGLQGAADAVRIGLEFLDRHALQPDGAYAWRFDLGHEVIDHTRDLYDHAFVLLALASATAVQPVSNLRSRALAVLHWIDDALPHPHGGYHESQPPSLPRRQNPHMHLLEALLTAYEVFGDAVFIDRARELVALFARHMFDAETGSLPEYFSDDLQPERTGGVFRVEPGHHCEWVWLLHRFQKLTSPQKDLQTISRSLMGFVDRFGVDRLNGGIVDVVASDGRVVEANARLWPQTERLKAEFLRENGSDTQRQAAIDTLYAFLRPDGLWNERRRQDGIFDTLPAPASSLYHLTASILCIAQT